MAVATEVEDPAWNPEVLKAADHLLAYLSSIGANKGRRCPSDWDSRQFIGTFATIVKWRRTALNNEGVRQVLVLAQEVGAEVQELPPRTADDVMADVSTAVGDVNEQLQRWWGQR